MTMRFRTRAFLICFLPFTALLGCSFWMVQRFVQMTMREDLRASLRRNQHRIDAIQARSALQNSRFLAVAGEDASLKAGIELLLSAPENQAARRTVDDQLIELGEHMGFDLIVIYSAQGVPLAGAIRAPANPDRDAQLIPLQDVTRIPALQGVIRVDGQVFQVGSVTLDTDQENLGSLFVGQHFDFSEFSTPTVLFDHGKAVDTNLAKVSLAELDSSLTGCDDKAECDLRLHGVNWISVPILGTAGGGGFSLRSLEDLDAATGPVQLILDRLFLTVALGSLLVALMCSVASSRSIVRPIAALVTHLRGAGRTGELPEFANDLSSILEIRELAQSYNRAAVSVRKARENLHLAYVESVGSLANALDASDRYTAGHSRRVSDLSCATARAMNLSDEDIERIRLGAILHDIGKIGISDAVLHKPGPLTDEEFAIVRNHPVVGRHILEGVQGFAPFLPAVELHHENWDGTGYPHGQRGEETPIEARIIHVSDAYDAMTTDRPYRAGRTHECALRILRENAGTQFDPAIVEVFLHLDFLSQIAASPASPEPFETWILHPTGAR